MKIAFNGFVYIAFMIIGILGNSKIALAANATPVQNRYIYCNIYLDQACFGIAPGDHMEMKIPGDYVLYSIGLTRGMKVLIYSGNNPEGDTVTSSQGKRCSAASIAGKCTFLQKNDVLDILYQADSNSPFIHIHVNGIVVSNVDEARDFLENFRACKPVAQSITCTEERIFKDVITSLRP